MQSTIIAELIDHDEVARARQRLEVFLARHQIDIERFGTIGRQDDAGWINEALTEIHQQGEQGIIPKRHYRNALAVFRRAINHDRATFLHMSDGRAYAAW